MEMVAKISLIVTLVFAGFVLIGALIGFFKGWKKTLVGLCRTLAAIIVAFIGAKIIAAVVPAELIYRNFIEPIIQNSEQAAELLEASPTLETFIMYSPYALVLPFIFVLGFIFWNLILMIPAHFVKKAILKPKNTPEGEEVPKENVGKKVIMFPIRLVGRIGGAALKACTTLIVILVLLLPITGIVHMLTDGLGDVAQTATDSGATFGEGDSEIDGEKLTEIQNTYITPVTDNAFLQMSYNPVGKAMFTGLTQVKLNGKNCYLNREIEQLYKLVSDCTYFFVDVDKYDERQENAVNNVVAYISESEFHSSVTAEVLAGMGKSWNEGKSFIGINAPNTDVNTEIIMKPMLNILSNSTSATVAADFTTLGSIIKIMIRYDAHIELAKIIKKSEDNGKLSIDFFRNEDFMYELLSAIYNNDNYRTMMRPTVRFGLTAALSSLGIDRNAVTLSDDAPTLDEAGLRAESKVMVAIIGNASDFVKSMPDNSSNIEANELIEKLDVVALGGLMDNIRHSALLGDSGVELFVAVLDSDKFDSMREVADVLSRHIKNDKDLNMTSLLKATKSLIAIAAEYKTGGGATDTAAIAGKLNELIQSVDKTTEPVIVDMVKTDFIQQKLLGAGGAGGNGEKVAELVTTMISTMAQMENLTDEELEVETKALDYAMKIATVQSSGAASAEDYKTVFKGEGDSADEMIVTLASSKLTTAALESVAYEKDENGNLKRDPNGNLILSDDAKKLAGSVSETEKKSVMASAETYYKNPEYVNDANRAEVEKNLNAIAAVFGEDLTDEFATWKSAT